MAHLINFSDYFRIELADLEPWQAMGLIRRESRALEVTELGWFGVRAIAMVFDRHLRSGQGAAQYSRVA
jgi:oxygen-independent coproporphyrinogen-3 oxidase